MKILNKIISLTMAVIILFTTTPVLQAADVVADLDVAQLNELKKEIAASISMSEIIKPKKPLYEGIPDIEVIKKRYQLSVENNQKNLEEFEKNETFLKEREDYVNFLKEEAVKRINEDPEYYGNKTKEEMLRDAFYTVLFDQIQEGINAENTYKDEKFGYYAGSAVGSMFIGSMTMFCLLLSGYTGKGVLYASLGVGVAVLLAFLLFTNPSVPYFSPNLTPYETKNKFLDSPFQTLISFDKKGVSDFELFYHKSKDCAQILYDAVDIEYYTSKNPNVENMSARLYTQTRYWQNLTTEERADYIHNFAERLRTEAK